jgi:hypothetical protein
MKYNKTFSQLLIIWKSELESNIEHIKHLKTLPEYYDFIQIDLLDSKTRIKFILEQIDFFNNPLNQEEEYDFSTINIILDQNIDFLKENKLI